VGPGVGTGVGLGVGTPVGEAVLLTESVMTNVLLPSEFVAVTV
jgi:hypothetical protein